MVGTGQTFDISRVLVSEEIRQIRRERWTGVLALARGAVSKALYFNEGNVVFASSTAEEDRLGANLCRVGRITEPQLRSAMTAARAGGRRLGQALIEAGVLHPEEVVAAVTGQVERIVLSVLRWTDGRLQRRAVEPPLPADLVLDLNVERLLLLGSRIFPDPTRLEPAVGEGGTRLRRVAVAPFIYEELPRSAPEGAVLERCVREATVAEVLALPHPRPHLLRAVYGLVASGLIENLGRAQPSRPAPDDDWRPDPEASALAGLETSPDDDGEGDESTAPPSPDMGERQALSLLERGQREAAVALLGRLVESWPDAWGCRRLLAMTLTQAGPFSEEAERHCLAALEADSKDVELRHRLASYYRRAGMTARAILQLRLILSVDPSHGGAWRDLGEIEGGQKKRVP